MINPNLYDLLIIGGGINGAGIAADAAGRNLRVLLCEQGDLAQATSSSSSKLIHGGLRYLEQYEFKLVRKALKERDILLHAAPHLISPLHFVLPYATHLRPAWLIRLGLFVYDSLAGKTHLPRSRRINFKTGPYAHILKSNFTYGFEYTDCWADDARLVISNALSAEKHNATILSRTRVISAQRHETHWEVTTENSLTLEKTTYHTKLLVNAAGPWVDNILNNTLHIKTKTKLTLVKGSHIIVPRFYQGNHAYLLQHFDERIIFVIPFEKEFTLIGTTDVLYNGDPLAAHIDNQEISYLCELVNYYFNHQITDADIVHTYSGVRPLIESLEDDAKTASELTRDYKINFDHGHNTAPLLSIFGGKITTYRQLAEEAINLLKPIFPELRPAWTEQAILPGGDIPHNNMPQFIKNLSTQYSWLPEKTLQRFARTYGTRIHLLLENTHSLSDLGKCIGADLYEKEVAFLRGTEWALTSDDILWRRSKLGLFFSAAEKENLSRYCD